MPIAYIGLGTNLGEKTKNLEKAAAEMEARALGLILRRSKIYETAPVGGHGMTGDFLNQAVELATEIAPAPLLSALKAIENAMGRTRKGEPVVPRVIDLDILLYDSVVVDEKDLTIPHPRLLERLFVLKPLHDLGPDLFHPVARKTIRDLLAGAPASVSGQRVRAL
jgi:2-amino-4-hydroxy-6-hydroxymethyldihydropteridine diphosphokinase